MGGYPRGVALRVALQLHRWGSGVALRAGIAPTFCAGLVWLWCLLLVHHRGGVVVWSVHTIAPFCARPLCRSGCQISSGGGAVGARSKHRQAPCAVSLLYLLFLFVQADLVKALPHKGLAKLRGYKQGYKQGYKHRYKGGYKQSPQTPQKPRICT